MHHHIVTYINRLHCASDSLCVYVRNKHLMLQICESVQACTNSAINCQVSIYLLYFQGNQTITN